MSIQIYKIMIKTSLLNVIGEFFYFYLRILNSIFVNNNFGIISFVFFLKKGMMICFQKLGKIKRHLEDLL